MIKEKFDCWFIRKNWATTIYPYIFYGSKKEEVPESLRRHEMVHIKQVKKMGWFKFYISYLWLLLIKGYKNHPYEIEARKAE